MTTGPLGQGHRQQRSAWRWPSAFCRTPSYGDDLVDHYTYVIAGDGCLMEGISHEAASTSPATSKLSKLILLFDDNEHLNRRWDGTFHLRWIRLARFLAAYGWRRLTKDRRS